jgi:hypothetical protein
MRKQATGQPSAADEIVLSQNAIIDGKWYAAGEPLPFASAAAVPDPLKPFVISEAAAAEPQGSPGIRRPNINRASSRV